MEGKKKRPPYLIVLRKFFSDEMWLSEKFTRAMAFMDLWYWAFHSDGNFKWDGKRYDLKRGQLCHTETFLAKRWKWSRNKVRRVFAKWKKDGMITAQPLAHQVGQHTAQRRNVITVCNYDEIQFTPNGHGTTDETSSRPTDGMETAHNKNKLKRNNYRNNYKKLNGELKTLRKDKTPKQNISSQLNRFHSKLLEVQHGVSDKSNQEIFSELPPDHQKHPSFQEMVKRF